MYPHDRLDNPNRRDFLARGASLVAALSAPGAFSCSSGGRPHLDTALRTADWLFANRIALDTGVVWPADSAQPDDTQVTLYHGTPGVVLFLTELFDVTQDQRFMDEAMRGADHLASIVRGAQELGNGLYVGLGGIGFVLDQVARASGRAEYRDAARLAFDQIVERAEPLGVGVVWRENGNEIADIVSGTSGIALCLLYAHERLETGRALETAAAAGARLIQLGEYAETGQKWAVGDGVPFKMPNFSHGTAGVAYTLARLHEATGRGDFLASAVNGGWYLQSVMTRDDDEAWRIFHREPDGEDLFYLSWCHGPVGTSRLFYQLAKQTGDEVWMDFVHHGAQGILNTGIPEQRTPGFWNNVSQCCGTCGVGEFFMTLAAISGRREYREFVDRTTADLHGRSTADETGIRWVQAEHRVQPELLQAQTGLMQGAAGMGLYFLHLDAFDRAAGTQIRLPDSPFV